MEEFFHLIFSIDIQYRIADGPTENQGRVEMSIGGVWGTICDAYWDAKDADVFCRSLNYSTGQHLKADIFGPGNGTVWISHVHCNGSEDNLLQCPHEGFNTSFSDAPIVSWTQEYMRSSYQIFKYCFDHESDAAVYCFGNGKILKKLSFVKLITLLCLFCVDT